MVTLAQQRQFAWLIAIIFFAGSVLGFVDRAVLGIVLPQVRKDLSLSNTQYSLAINGFLIMYLIFYVLGGRTADLLGSRRTFSLLIMFWSLASMAHAFTRGFASLCLFRALLGIGEGGFYPTAMKGITEWFPTENRAKAIGLLICGVSLGMLLTPPVVAWVTLHHGWRMAFLVTGSAGFFLIPPWLWLHRCIKEAYGTRDPAPAHITGPNSLSTEGLTLGQAFTKRKYWLFLLARAFPDAVTFFYLFWLPGYFQDARHYDLEKVGKLLWIPFFCAGLGALGGAWLSSALMQRGWGLDRARKIPLFLSATCSIVGSGAFLAPSHIVALVLVSVALFGHFAWSSNIQTVITEVLPRKHLAALYGATGAAGTLMGAVTQPLVGYSVDRVGYGPAFAGTALTYILAISMLFGAGKIERIE